MFRPELSLMFYLVWLRVFDTLYSVNEGMAGLSAVEKRAHQVFLRREARTERGPVEGAEEG
jgi:hypothetical protein